MAGHGSGGRFDYVRGRGDLWVDKLQPASLGKMEASELIGEFEGRFPSTLRAIYDRVLKPLAAGGVVAWLVYRAVREYFSFDQREHLARLQQTVASLVDAVNLEKGAVTERIQQIEANISGITWNEAECKNSLAEIQLELSKVNDSLPKVLTQANETSESNNSQVIKELASLKALLTHSSLVPKE